MALSAALAMFPLLILLSATAGYVGKAGDAAALASRVMNYAPQLFRDAMRLPRPVCASGPMAAYGQQQGTQHGGLRDRQVAPRPATLAGQRAFSGVQDA